MNREMKDRLDYYLGARDDDGLAPWTRSAWGDDDDTDCDCDCAQRLEAATRLVALYEDERQARSSMVAVTLGALCAIGVAVGFTIGLLLW